MIRATLHFFLLGAAIFAARLVVASASPEPRALVVTVPSSASDDEVRLAVDEALLIEEGLRRGWARTDPVIRRRLVRNMRFVAGEPDDGPPVGRRREWALVEAAMRLDMHRTDPVVRRRLLERAERAIARSALSSPPSDAALRAHLEAHPERFARPALVRLSQVFLSRERHRDDLDAETERLAAELLRDALPPEEARRLGDPFPHDPRGGTVSIDRLARTFGASFADAVEHAPVGRWSGPYESAYGRHFLWVHEVERRELPALDAVRDAVARSLRHDLRARARAEFLRRLRPYYDVRVERRDEVAP